MRFAPFTAFIVLASCSSAFEPGSSSAAGTYALATVDGASLPATIAAGLTVRGALELGTTRYTLTQTDSSGGSATTASTAGSWSVTDNALQLIQDGNILQLGILVGDTVRLAYRSHENVYVRR